MPECVIDGNDISNSIILKQVSKINKIETNLLESIELFIALKNICSTKLPSILGILMIIIK